MSLFKLHGVVLLGVLATLVAGIGSVPAADGKEGVNTFAVDNNAIFVDNVDGDYHIVIGNDEGYRVKTSLLLANGDEELQPPCFPHLAPEWMPKPWLTRFGHPASDGMEDLIVEDTALRHRLCPNCGHALHVDPMSAQAWFTPVLCKKQRKDEEECDESERLDERGEAEVTSIMEVMQAVDDSPLAGTLFACGEGKCQENADGCHRQNVWMIDVIRRVVAAEGSGEEACAEECPACCEQGCAAACCECPGECECPSSGVVTACDQQEGAVFVINGTVCKCGADCKCHASHGSAPRDCKCGPGCRCAAPNYPAAAYPPPAAYAVNPHGPYTPVAPHGMMPHPIMPGPVHAGVPMMNVYGPGPMGGPEPMGGGHVSALRETAHHLDCTAAMLEDREEYDRADELRAMAQQLREDGRELPREHPPLDLTYEPTEEQACEFEIELAAPCDAEARIAELEAQLQHALEELHRVREAALGTPGLQ